jgi:hypothetical protein
MKRLLLLLSSLGTAAALFAADPAPVDVSTLNGKLMVGYQGWFNAEGDGAGRGWTHWTKGRGAPSPDNIRVDLWPDLSELGPDERFPTAFIGADGKPAEVFSSFKRETVLRHFRWMREYGIDGAFLQRFPSNLRDTKARTHLDTVLAHCRAGAKIEGRALALMYDLSGLPGDRFHQVKDDWRRLSGEGKLTADDQYIKHRGKPLVAVWGVGFDDQRPYSLEQCRDLVAFFREQGCSILLGVPCYWRTLDRDAVSDRGLLDLLAGADVVSPWTIGRYGTLDGAKNHAEKNLKPDLAWCAERKIDYLPVAYPGFSWHNMKRDSPIEEIPRRKGEFFQTQLDGCLAAGARMIYVAMFDEVDEATAIFKCTNTPPPGRPFATYEGLPSDHYLKLAGDAARRLKAGSK